MPDSPETSIIVVNRDDPRVEDTLTALATLRAAHDVEVIVVDASEGRLDDVRERNRWVQWIDFERGVGTARTIAQQRNVGVRAATGSVLVFLDANCIPEDGWLDVLLGPIRHGD